ncbi:MAG: translation initiation factor IF-3 [bacterium]
MNADPVRLVDASSRQVGVVSLAEARSQAEIAGLDLVEVAPLAKPPVVRIIDWGKFRYEQDKHLAKSKRTQKQVDTKQVRLGLKTESHDLDVKHRAAVKFLEKGHKVRVNVRFRGREITHPELGRAVLDKFCARLEDITFIEQPASMAGRELSAVLARKKDAKNEDE